MQKVSILLLRLSALIRAAVPARGSVPVCRFGKAAFFALFSAIFWLGGCATPPPSYNVTRFSTVVIDAGHGGHDSGALSRRRGRGGRLLEKDLALDTARRVEVKLRAAGLRTVMTRSDDRFIPLDDRVAISNSQRNSIFVSIHFNDSRKRYIRGTETYHNGRGTEELANRIAHSVASGASGKKRLVQRANFRVLRNSRGPAVLIECGYLSHSAEAAMCGIPAYRERLADAIVKAILEQRR